MRINESVPIQWSANVGDIIHNLRSALDHLAYELVQANGRLATKTTFPISDNEAKFKAHFPQALHGASTTAISTIESLKPYKGGNDDLWRIHQLDIIDKHRAIVTVGVAYEHLKVNVEYETLTIPVELPLYRLTADFPYPIEDGFEVCRLNSAARAGLSTISKHEFTLMVAFGERHIVDRDDLLQTLRRFVSVVEQVVRDVSEKVPLP